MKSKRKIACIMCTVLFIALCAGSAAAIDCSEAVISVTGVYPTKANETTSPYMVILDCKDDSVWSGNRQFYLSKDLGESGYATLLTAKSLSKTIFARVGGTTSGSLVHILYLNPTDE